MNFQPHSLLLLLSLLIIIMLFQWLVAGFFWVFFRPEISMVWDDDADEGPDEIVGTGIVKEGHFLGRWKVILFVPPSEKHKCVLLGWADRPFRSLRFAKPEKVLGTPEDWRTNPPLRLPQRASPDRRLLRPWPPQPPPIHLGKTPKRNIIC